MGHYDDLYEATERETRARYSKEAHALAKAKRLPILAASEFEPLGVCDVCANVVYAVPNWACNRPHVNCPHKPR